MRTTIILVSLSIALGCGKKKPQPNPNSLTKPELTSELKTSPAKPKTETKKPGTVLWEFKTGSYVSSSPTIGSDGTVYVRSWDNKLYAIKTDPKGLAKSP
jgi:hypothetical protein